MTWFAVLILTWLLVAALALQAHRRGRVRVARRWTTRLYAVTLVPLTALAVGAALVGVQLAFAQTGTEQAVVEAAPYAQWLALAINLVLADIVMQRRPVQTRTRARARAWHGARQGTVPVEAVSVAATHAARAPERLPRAVPAGR